MKRGVFTPIKTRSNRDLTFGGPLRFTSVDIERAFFVGKAPARSSHRNGPRSRKARA